MVTGCSFTSHTPSKLPLDEPHFGCSVGPAAIDTTIGAPLTAIAVILLGRALLRDEGGNAYVAGAAIIGVPYTISAIYGWHDHARCRRLMAATDRDWALAYASHAEQLASSSDCAEAWAIGAKVDARDHELYLHDFLERPAMVECRTAAREAAEATRLEEERRKAYHERQNRRDQALEVGKRARDAAKRAACDEARTLARQAAELDAEVYKGIARDPEIAKCIASSTSTAPAPGDAPP